MTAMIILVAPTGHKGFTSSPQPTIPPQFPLCRAEHRSIYREQPVRGAAGMPHFARRTGMSFLANPDKCEKHRKQAASGRLFFGYFLLRKISPAFSAFTTSMWLGEVETQSIASLQVRGCENPHSNKRRVSNTILAMGAFHTPNKKMISIMVRKTPPTIITLSRIQLTPIPYCSPTQ